MNGGRLSIKMKTYTKYVGKQKGITAYIHYKHATY